MKRGKIIFDIELIKKKKSENKLIKFSNYKNTSSSNQIKKIAKVKIR